MTSDEPVPKVAIQPVDCLGQGNRLIGEQYWLFVGILLVVLLIVSALPIILQGPMYCGVYICLLARERGETVTFERVFKGFDLFLESLVATLIYTAGVLLIVLPFILVLAGCFAGGAAAMDERNEGLGILLFGLGGLGALVFTVLCLLLTVLFTFTYPLIVDRKLSALEAVKLSCRAGLKNIWGLSGLTLLIGLISMLCALACYLPIFLFVPVAMAANWIAYRKIFPAIPQEGEEENATEGDPWASDDPPPPLPEPAG